MYLIFRYLASLRFSLMAAKDVAVWQVSEDSDGIWVTIFREEAAPSRRGTAKVKDDVQESSVRRLIRSLKLWYFLKRCFKKIITPPLLGVRNVRNKPVIHVKIREETQLPWGKRYIYYRSPDEAPIQKYEIKVS